MRSCPDTMEEILSEMESPSLCVRYQNLDEMWTVMAAIENYFGFRRDKDDPVSFGGPDFPSIGFDLRADTGRDRVFRWVTLIANERFDVSFEDFMRVADVAMNEGDDFNIEDLID